MSAGLAGLSVAELGRRLRAREVRAAEVIEEIKAEIERIKKESFPPGMDY